MKIFLSYASEQSELARELALALEAENHSVFLDRTSLRSGEAYNAKIRKAIEGSQLFLFLISPDSIAAGRYTLTELEFAEHKWPRPWGKVLPVMVTPTPRVDIPPYLRAGTILQPSGNLSATVVAEVERIAKSGWSRRLQRYRKPLLAFLSLAILGAGAAWWFWKAQAERAPLASLVSAAKIQRDTGHYEEAWKLLEQAQSLAPNDSEVDENVAKLGMALLENARYVQGEGNFSEIVDKFYLPALSRCSVSSDQVRAADCLAHMGWSDFLKSREGGSLEPDQFYRRALALDPENPYAHAMSGFDILVSHGSLDEAKEHFARALASGRERPYVRRMQLAGFLYFPAERLEDEAIRVVNEIRLQNEPLPAEDRDDSLRWSKLWNLYYSRILNGNGQESFLAALSPSEHLATFQWLYPANAVPDGKRDLYRFFLGNLQELAGHNADALATFRGLQRSLGRNHAGGRLPDKTAEAIQRLSKLNRDKN